MSNQVRGDCREVMRVPIAPETWVSIWVSGEVRPPAMAVLKEYINLWDEIVALDERRRQEKQGIRANWLNRLFDKSG